MSIPYFEGTIPTDVDWATMRAPLTIERLQKFIDDLTGERPRLVMIVTPQAYPTIAEWADRLREACNIVEVRASEFCPPGQMLVIVHPDDYLAKISYPIRGHHYAPQPPPPKVKITDLTGY